MIDTIQGFEDTTWEKKKTDKIYTLNEFNYVPRKKPKTKNKQKTQTKFFILFLTGFFYSLVFKTIPLILSGFYSFPSSLDYNKS